MAWFMLLRLLEEKQMRTFLTHPGKYKIPSSSASASASVGSAASRTSLLSTMEKGDEDMDNYSIGDSSMADESKGGNSTFSAADASHISNISVDSFLKADRDSVISKLMDKERVITLLYANIFPVQRGEEGGSSSSSSVKGACSRLGLLPSGGTNQQSSPVSKGGNPSTLQSLSCSDLFDISPRSANRANVKGGESGGGVSGGGAGGRSTENSRGSEAGGDSFSSALLKPLDYGGSSGSIINPPLNQLRPGTTGLLKNSPGNTPGGSGDGNAVSSAARATTSGQS
jgi:hypothetical protein